MMSVAVGITQTGGQCRFSSYLSLIKKALVSAGFRDVPVVAIASDQVLNQQGLKFDLKKIAKKAMLVMFFADSLMQMYNSTVVREVNRGDARRLMGKYLSLL